MQVGFLVGFVVGYFCCVIFGKILLRFCFSSRRKLSDHERPSDEDILFSIRKNKFNKFN